MLDGKIVASLDLTSHKQITNLHYADQLVEIC